MPEADLGETVFGNNFGIWFRNIGKGCARYDSGRRRRLLYGDVFGGGGDKKAEISDVIAAIVEGWFGVGVGGGVIEGELDLVMDNFGTI
ncbi:MAG: hypothetical protein UV68_C0043G0009 [Candidatus Collierbacteria bacterium GW2011_GWC2_43_12]|uniref:Uncharacterized protein n=1 Tax=Candidatus Collierbacteria bacterium GW2011_GWC2_43_12 TaxID=1618390 RepID=A0A0G1D4A2_9BACT|nr:MAG: hypothetical protein UV68_C0043G0009 [Candidatus Collierbacteria bacterium GW2011_GWC2_43_12]